MLVEKHKNLIQKLNELNNKNEYEIGTIDFSNIINEESIGSISFGSKLGLATVFIRNGEGDNIPHCHLKFKDYKDCCIMLYDNRYFNHGIKSTTIDGYEKLFDSWCNSKSKKIDGLNNWQVMCYQWDIAIGEFKRKTQQPNYKTIQSYK